MMWISGAKGRYFALVGIAVFSAVALVLTRPEILEGFGFASSRIESFINKDTADADSRYQTLNGLYAIGSGGLTGKGFLNGTQTKLKYVPEQDTDFIFCTIGEEQGFLGSTFVLVFFVVFILRLIFLAERQNNAFGRAYGYALASIFFFHFSINIGMVIGIVPVIGIPLPFFSYGGSSFLGFSILLFSFLRIDADREIARR